MDSGCSSWLVKDGVPEKELKSIKLRDGPIPMGVAGGHTVYATAEWASLLPLADGSHQIVRGLSSNMVTGNFGDIHMDPIIEEVKEAGRNTEGPGVDEVKRLRAPKEISGEVDMLIGSRYLSIFPEPVFSTNDGLTLYKSKFLPQVQGEVSCIGGPSKALSQLVRTGGVVNVINMFTRIIEQQTLPKEFKVFKEVSICQGDADSRPKEEQHTTTRVKEAKLVESYCLEKETVQETVKTLCCKKVHCQEDDQQKCKNNYHNKELSKTTYIPWSLGL